MGRIKRFNPSFTEIFISGYPNAYLTGRWFIRDWVDKTHQYLMVEIKYLNEKGEEETDWWCADDNWQFTQDRPVQGKEVGEYRVENLMEVPKITTEYFYPIIRIED